MCIVISVFCHKPVLSILSSECAWSLSPSPLSPLSLSSKCPPGPPSALGLSSKPASSVPGSLGGYLLFSHKPVLSSE